MIESRPNYILEDQSEKIHYTYEDYPVYIRRDRLSDYPNYSGVSHWHQAPEFIYVLAGEMTYSVNGRRIFLPQGSGIMVNSGHLHFGYSADRQECIFICLIVSPLLLSVNAYFETQYVRPVLKNADIPCLFLSPETDWQKEILDCVSSIYRLGRNGRQFLEMQQLLLSLWSRLFHHTVSESAGPEQENTDLVSVKSMVFFIHQNYADKVSLKQIAAAGNVCKSKCCSLFRTYLSRTPGEYLNEYRLRKSLDDLVHTDKTISETALRAGINSASYYSELFRKCFGCSPTEFIKQYRRDESAHAPARQPNLHGYMAHGFHS